MRITELNFSVKNLVIAGVTLFALILLYKVSSILIMLFVSVLIAYILNPLVRPFMRLGMSRTVSVIIMTAILSVIVLISLAIALPIVIEDAILISKNIPEYAKYLFGLAERTMQHFGVDVSLAHIQALVVERLGIISQYAFNTLMTAAASVSSIVNVLLNLFIVPVLVFFLLKDFPDVRDFIKKFVARMKFESVVDRLSEFERFVGKYYRGMLVVGIILSVLYTGVLIAVGVNGALGIGIMTGLGAMIPYVGFTIGLITAVIVTLVQFQDFIHPLYVIAGYMVVQFLESMVITPKIVGESLGLSPPLVIVGLMIGGALFGFVGMLIALPVTAFLKSMLNRYFFKEKEENVES